MMRKCVILFCLILVSLVTDAQTSIPKDNPVEIEPGSNLLFVAVGVLCILIIGVYVYLFSMDKKITNLEKNSWK